MKKEIEKMYNIMPSTVKDSDLLSDDAKKVLASLLYSFSICEDAKENKVIVIPNSRLRKVSSIKQNSLLPAIRELEMYDLVTRKKGEKRTKGKSATASKYYINFENLKKPLKEKTFDDIFGGIGNVGYCNSNSNCNSNCNNNFNLNVNYNLNDNLNVNDNVNYNYNVNSVDTSNNTNINNDITNNNTTMKELDSEKELDSITSSIFGTTPIVESTTTDDYIIPSVLTDDERLKVNKVFKEEIKPLLKVYEDEEDSRYFEILEDISICTNTLLHTPKYLDSYCDLLRDYSVELFKDKNYSPLKDKVDALIDSLLKIVTVQVF